MRKNRVTKLIATSALVLALAVLLALASACGNGGGEEPGVTPTPGVTPAQPRIFFYEDSVDVGIIPPGVALDYTFHFKNVGDALLVLKVVSARALEGC